MPSKVTGLSDVKYLVSMVTYEGTHDIHLLITGADVTGLQAFK